MQKPHPPIWIGGSSPAALRRAARFADAWHPSHRPVDEIAAGAQQFKTLAAERGRDPGRLQVVARAPLRIVSDGHIPEPRPLLVGTPEQIVDDVGTYRAAGVTGFMFDTYYGSPAVNEQDLSGVLRTLETFAEKVRPRLGSI